MPNRSGSDHRPSLPRRLLFVLWMAMCANVGAQETPNPTLACEQPGYSDDVLIDSARDAKGKRVPYILTGASDLRPQFAIIVMPGSAGRVSPSLQDGTLNFQGKCNFLVRSRILFANDRTVVVTTDADPDVDRMRAIVTDITRRYPSTRIFIAGTSRSTMVTMTLAPEMDGEVAGFIHTASLAGIAHLDTRQLISRHLIVSHANDGCRVTPPSASIANHRDFGTELLLVEGGVTQCDPCKAFSYHGFNGTERFVVQYILDWIRR